MSATTEEIDRRGVRPLGEGGLQPIGGGAVLLLAAPLLLSSLINDVVVKEVLIAAGLVSVIFYMAVVVRQPLRLGNPLIFFLGIQLFTVVIQGLLHDLRLTDFVFELRAGDADYQVMALELVGVGSLSYLVAFCSVFNVGCSLRRPVGRRPCEEPVIRQRAAYLLFGGWAVSQALLIIMLGGIGTAYLPVAATERYDSSLIMVLLLGTETGFVGLLWIMSRASHMPPLSLAGKLLIAATLGLHVLMMMGAGAKWHIVRFFLAFLIISERKCWTRGTPAKSIRNLFLLAAAVAMSFCVIGPYRQIARANEASIRSDSTFRNVRMQVSYFIQAAEMALRGETPADTVDSAGGRLSNLTSLMRVLAYLDGQPAYDNLAQAPLVPLYSVLPRTLFPNKAALIGPGEFAQMNGWTFGGLSLTLAGSLFWIGGWLGVIVGFGLFGAIVGWYWAASVTSGHNSDVAFAICMLATLTLWDPEWHSLLINLIRFRIALAAVLVGATMLHRAQARRSAHGQPYPGPLLADSQ